MPVVRTEDPETGIRDSVRKGDGYVGGRAEGTYFDGERYDHLDSAEEIVVEGIPLDEDVDMHREPGANPIQSSSGFQPPSTHERRTADRKIRFAFDLHEAQHLPVEAQAGNTREFRRVLEGWVVTADGQDGVGLAGPDEKCEAGRKLAILAAQP